MEELRTSIIETQQKLKIQSREENPSTLMRWKAVRDYLLDRQKIVSLQKEELESELIRIRDELSRERERARVLDEKTTNLMVQLKREAERERELDEAKFSKL